MTATTAQNLVNLVQKWEEARSTWYVESCPTVSGLMDIAALTGYTPLKEGKPEQEPEYSPENVVGEEVEDLTFGYKPFLRLADFPSKETMKELSRPTLFSKTEPVVAIYYQDHDQIFDMCRYMGLKSNRFSRKRDGSFSYLDLDGVCYDVVPGMFFVKDPYSGLSTYSPETFLARFRLRKKEENDGSWKKNHTILQ